MSRVTKSVIALLTILLSISSPVLAEKQKFPPRFQAVLDYLLKTEYPELIGDKSYKIRPNGFDIGDLDGDGVDEVVVSFFPHYRQSPTIMIFKVDNKMKVTRIKEGLAPGKLVPVSGEYLDSHVGGHGVDMSLGKGDMKKPNAMKDFIEVSTKEMGGVVAYKNFLHMDGRKGNGMYIDMMHIKNPPKDKTCEKFEFARVENLQIVQKKKDPTPIISALVGGDVYFYKINKIRKDGFIDKTIDVVPLDEGKK